MAESTVNVREVSFRFSISDISKLNDTVWSPEYLIDGVPWKVFVYKNVRGAEPTLALFLYCTKPDSSSNWSHVASASIELLSYKSGCVAKKDVAGPHVFDHLSRNIGSLIRWAELFDAENGFVKDDAIDLQITIRAESSKAKVTSFENTSRSCNDGCLMAFRMTVSNIESLTAVKAPTIILRKTPCELLLFKRSNYLGICLLFKPVPQDLKFFAELSADLISSNAAVKHCGKVQGIVDEVGTLEILQLLPWGELLEPNIGLIKDGTITIEFEIKTELLPAGSEPSAKKRIIANDQSAAKHLKMDCQICKKQINNQDISSLPCGHLFCSPCITESIKVQKVCPSCDVRANLNGLRRILLPKSK